MHPFLPEQKGVSFQTEKKFLYPVNNNYFQQSLATQLYYYIYLHNRIQGYTIRLKCYLVKNRKLERFNNDTIFLGKSVENGNSDVV